MKKLVLLFITFGLFSTVYSLDSTKVNSGSIINKWTWEKSIGGPSNPYIATPKTNGYKKKIVFTEDGRIITYKDDIEIRNSAYELTKGISVIDNSEHDLITFEGRTYVIENLDNQNLTIVCNGEDASRSIFKR
ncbi:hypothetical protein B4N84_13140 [Flavobacterium sp. IR1]|nr:hypothetical protein B4N84_13140 [Flavobacterium sp. IR1]